MNNFTQILQGQGKGPNGWHLLEFCNHQSQETKLKELMVERGSYFPNPLPECNTT